MEIHNYDVDIQLVVNDVLDGIVKVLEEKNIKLNYKRDILIYHSHGPNKQSVHIVIDNYCHTDNIQARAFYDEVLKHVSVSYRNFVDDSVYHKLQQFRIVNSHKNGSNRHKTFQKEWKWGDKIIKHKYIRKPSNKKNEFTLQLLASLITNIRNCEVLPQFKEVQRLRTCNNLIEISKTDAYKAFLLLAKKAGCEPDHPEFPYAYEGVNEKGEIELRRLKPSKCQICLRVHENQNPYLFIFEKNRKVYFNCRQCKFGEKLEIGYLDGPRTKSGRRSYN